MYQRRRWDELKRVLSVAHASEPVERAENLEYRNQLFGVCWGAVYFSNHKDLRSEPIFWITLYISVYNSVFSLPSGSKMSLFPFFKNRKACLSEQLQTYISPFLIPFPKYYKLSYNRPFHTIWSPNLFPVIMDLSNLNIQPQTLLLILTLLIPPLVQFNRQIDVINFDFSNSFHPVPHAQLLTKLDAFTLSHACVAWLRSYWSNWSSLVL